MTAELETPRLRSLGEMLDYAIVRMVKPWPTLTILGFVFLVLPSMPNIVLGPTHARHWLWLTVVAELLLDFIGYGACACVIAPLSPQLRSKTAAVRALTRTFSIAAFLVSATSVFAIGVLIAAIPLFIYFAVNAGRHAYPVVFSACIGLIILACVIISVPLTLLSNVGIATIVREGIGTRTAFRTCLRRFFTPSRRKRSAIVALCSIAPGLIPIAIDVSLDHQFSHESAIWQTATLLMSAAAELFSLSLCITYDEDLRARFEGADLIAAAERLLPEPAAS